jgi:hypothetical protein
LVILRVFLLTVSIIDSHVKGFDAVRLESSVDRGGRLKPEGEGRKRITQPTSSK